MQDYYLKYELTGVPGVSEVASVGGFVRQYQITVDPTELRAYHMPISRIRRAVERSNRDVGGRLLEISEKEFMIRGLGYIRSMEDMEKISLGVDEQGTPILLGDLAKIRHGPELRRGIAEWNGEGEVVGGIIVIRYGANARQVIGDVKSKLAELKRGLPEGVSIEVGYDRTGLIERAVDNLTEKLLEESAVVALVCIVFLLHFRSALVAIITLPLAVLIAFVVMHPQGINANIMSLGGIAIAIGTMVDASIIMVENGHKHLERKRGKQPHWQIISEAAKEVGPAIFYSLLVITVSFMPVFTLGEQEGRLFKPLAYTKTYAMAAAALLSITLVPVLMGYFVRGRVRSEERNPISRLLRALYHPVLEFVMRFKWPVLLMTIVLLFLTWVPFSELGSEFMPPLWEGDLLYMPTTLPGISVTKARELLQQTDKIIKTFPEVEAVFGKVGRAETATDPAPLSMIETTIMLKPEEEWREGMTKDRLIGELDAAIQVPGLTNSWTMPIRTRIDMLATGIRTPVGVKLGGPDLTVLEDLGREIESVLRLVPGTASAYAERVMGGNYLDFEIDRDAIARYGLLVADVQEVLQTAIGGMNITTTVEGLDRYPVNLRYGRELRDDLESLRAVLVPTPQGQHVPLGQLSQLSFQEGPPMIKSENARPNAWIFVDIAGVDVGNYVENARRAVEEQVSIPPGYTVTWSGQYEYMKRSQERLMFVIPLTLILIFVILYLNLKSLTKVMIVLLAVPFSLIGAVWFLYLLGYNMSIAVWVGLIALAGLDAETGVVMLLYLDVAHRDYRERGLLTDRKGLADAIYLGAVKRIRPKVMTVLTIIVGLLPIMWSTGTGADVMKRIAAPMVGGSVSSLILELAIYPILYYVWRGRRLPKGEPFGGYAHLREAR
jgi:Cu(I)/Ag(I) efflux system membrane protein CusA/SilA